MICWSAIRSSRPPSAQSPPQASAEELLKYYHDVVFDDMNKVRAIIDHLETLVASDFWPVPTYYDLLFSV